MGGKSSIEFGGTVSWHSLRNAEIPDLDIDRVS